MPLKQARFQQILRAALPICIVLVLYVNLRLYSRKYALLIYAALVLGGIGLAVWALLPRAGRPGIRLDCASLILGAVAGLATMPSFSQIIHGWGLAALWVGLTLGYALIFLGASRWFGEYARADSPVAADGCLTPAQAGWSAVALTCLAMGLMWSLHFPCIVYPDAVHQWKQIHGELRYTAVHALGHTLLLKLLYSIYDSPVIVVGLHIISTAAMNGVFAVMLTRRGAKPWHIATVTSLVGLESIWLAVCISPLKDLPYTVCLGFVTLLIMRWADDPSCFEGRGLWRPAVLGLLLGGQAVLRLNGMVALVVLGLFFLIVFLRRRLWRQALAMALSAALLIGGVYGYSFGALHAINPPNGFSIQTVGSGLAAIANDPEVTEEELEAIGAILPLDWIQERYVKGYGASLIWTQVDDIADWDEDDQVFNNHFVLQMGEHRAEAIRLYLRLLPRHFMTCVKDVVRNNRYIWQIGTPDSYRPRYVYIDHALLILILVLAAVTALRRGAHARALLPLAPVALNVASIAISAVTREMRYLMPTILLFAPLLFYLLTAPRANPRQK